MRPTHSIGLALWSVWLAASIAPTRAATPNRADQIDRPLRYRPDGSDFVIDDGDGYFNRPLYTAHTPFRVDAGDRPDFALLTPAKAGQLRLGIRTGNAAIWLSSAHHITARYRPGSMIYDISDPLLPGAMLHLTALPMQTAPGLVIQANLTGGEIPVELIWAFGGPSGEKERNNFDLVGGRDRRDALQLEPADCIGCDLSIAAPSFVMHARIGDMAGAASNGSVRSADAKYWNDLPALLNSSRSDQPVAVGRISLKPGRLEYLVIQPAASAPADLAGAFDSAQKYRQSVVAQVVVQTPDPFVNTVAGAISIAADDIWQPPTFMHGAVAWRTALLGCAGHTCWTILAGTIGRPSICRTGRRCKIPIRAIFRPSRTPIRKKIWPRTIGKCCTATAAFRRRTTT